MSWNIHFGDSFSDNSERISAFIQEAQGHGCNHITAAKVRKHLLDKDEEEEEEAPVQDTPSQVLPPKTATIVIPLALPEDHNSPLPFPPRAAAREIKKLIGNMMQPIIDLAAARAKDAARETWLQKFSGGTVELVPSTPCPGINDIWTQVRNIPQSGIHWRGSSFESEEVQVEYLQKVFDIIKGSEEAPLHVKILDTHQKGMRSPACCSDFTLVKGDCRHKEGDNVPWAEVASAGELKRVAGDAKEARLQFAEWAWQILRLQPA